MTRLHQLGWYHEVLTGAGPAPTSGSPENQHQAWGNDVFKSGRFAGAFHPLISIDLIVENERGEFLLGKQTPSCTGLLVPCRRARCRRDETLSTDAFERLTLAELGLQLPDGSGPVLRGLAALL